MHPCDFKHSRRLASAILAAFVSVAPAIHAQAPSAAKPATPSIAAGSSLKTFYLKNVSQQNDANEIMVALRNMLDPRVKIYLVNSQDAIVMEAPPEQLELAQTLISELDRPRKSYRLTFTIAEFDGNKRISARSMTMLAVSGQRGVLKQGSKVPVMTAGSDAAGATAQKAQSNYLDVGLSLDASVAEAGNGLSLKSKIEQSSVPDPTPGTAAQEQVVHQAVLEGTSALVLGKTATLGTMELPGGPRRVEIDVVAEPAL